MSSGLALTTLARVRELLEFDASDTTKDAFLTQLILDVSADMESSMRRQAKEQATTEVFTLPPTRHNFRVAGSPVKASPAPVLQISTTPDMTGVTALTENSDYTVEYAVGRFYLIVRSTGLRLSSGALAAPLFAKVVYTGGLGAATSDIATNYPDLARACDMQVCSLYRRRLVLEGNMTVGPSNTSYGTPGYDFLPAVERTLALHRRRSFS